jgi:uncharacterized protein YjcR
VTQENTEKPNKLAAKSADLKERIRYAATLKFLLNPTDAELAKQLGISVYTVADWKRRPEWREAVQAIAKKQLGETFDEMTAMAVYAREVVQDLMRKDAPPNVRLQAAQAVLRLTLNPGSRL